MTKNRAVASLYKVKTRFSPEKTNYHPTMAKATKEKFMMSKNEAASRRADMLLPVGIATSEEPTAGGEGKAMGRRRHRRR